MTFAGSPLAKQSQWTSKDQHASFVDNRTRQKHAFPKEIPSATIQEGPGSLPGREMGRQYFVRHMGFPHGGSRRGNGKVPSHLLKKNPGRSRKATGRLPGRVNCSSNSVSALLLAVSSGSSTRNRQFIPICF